MAYNADREVVEVIGDVDKGSKGDKIQVKKIKNKATGREQVDVRLMYLDEPSGEMRNGRQGVRFPTEILLSVTQLMASILTDEEKEQLVQGLGYTTTTEADEE